MTNFYAIGCVFFLVITIVFIILMVTSLMGSLLNNQWWIFLIVAAVVFGLFLWFLWKYMKTKSCFNNEDKIFEISDEIDKTEGHITVINAKIENISHTLENMDQKKDILAKIRTSISIDEREKLLKEYKELGNIDFLWADNEKKNELINEKMGLENIVSTLTADKEKIITQQNLAVKNGICMKGFKID